jgi:hypothetical protein
MCRKFYNLLKRGVFFVAVGIEQPDGMMARPGAAQLLIPASGELDYQIICNWPQSEFGLGQGIVE